MYIYIYISRGKKFSQDRNSYTHVYIHKFVHKYFYIQEKGLLRTEIAVLKLVNHPNIIRMEGLYESKQYLYIVMEMLTGGELFERIVGRPRFIYVYVYIHMCKYIYVYTFIYIYI
jgi:serine/threonine protein kinase